MPFISRKAAIYILCQDILDQFYIVLKAATRDRYLAKQDMWAAEAWNSKPGTRTIVPSHVTVSREAIALEDYSQFLIVVNLPIVPAPSSSIFAAFSLEIEIMLGLIRVFECHHASTTLPSSNTSRDSNMVSLETDHPQQ